MFKTFTKTFIIAALAACVPLLAACGESSQEKATKQVCAATSEISKEIKKLESLPINSSFPTEAKASVEAIDKSLKEVKSAEPNLEAARMEEVNVAIKSLESELATLTKTIVSASKSSSLESALKSAEPQLKASLSKLGEEYKKVHEALKCST